MSFTDSRCTTDDKGAIDFLLNPSAPTHSLQYTNSWQIESAVQELTTLEFQQFPLGRTAGQTRNHCMITACTTPAVSKGLCVRHGGGTRCCEPGCTKRTKRFRRCYMHGGYVFCNTEGCRSKAKRFGRCWAHGGGTQCAEVGCDKLSVKGGLCWTHGGGCRCRVQNCGRRAFKRFSFLCDAHFTETDQLGFPENLMI